MDKKELHSALTLSFLPSSVPSTYSSLLTEYGSAPACVMARPPEWNWDEALRQADTEIKEIERNGIRVYLRHVGPYPPMLKQLTIPPPIIYALGNDPLDSPTAVALVGSRRPTYYGEKVAREFSGGLADVGIATVSGLARGIDSHVHGETIRHGGKTWAVLGSGLLNIYPRENKNLAERVASNGAVLSEFPLHMRPYQGHFPRRNRIIAGLSWATVVIEGDEKSGSLITARLAGEEGRDVMAVPGPVHSSLSAGPHLLIQNGAKLVRRVEDILAELPDHLRPAPAGLFGSTTKGSDLQQAHRIILEQLRSTAVPKEVLVERCKLSPSEFSVTLLDLELRGKIRSLSGGLVERT